MRKIINTLWISLCFIGLMVGCQALEASEAGEVNNEEVVRIGYQKNGPLVILKSLGTLEEQLKPLGYHVEWKEFQAGPALVEALNAGSIDIGRTGNTPVIFAQASDVSFAVFAAGKSKYAGSGILVPEHSDIKNLQDLKGKEVGFAKGSSSHFLLVKALEEAGLDYTDITPAFLSPGDARVAFEQGNIDAMVVWDPYTASTEINSNGELLTDGEGLSSDRDFFIATESFAKDHGDLLKIIEEEVIASSDWANENHEDLIAMLAPILNLDEASIEKAVKRRIYGVEEVNEEMIIEQQDIADKFYELNIIPKKIDVRHVMK